jgi:hypothetical protein
MSSPTPPTIVTVVLVNEDPVYQRVNHNARLLLFQRPQEPPTHWLQYYWRSRLPPIPDVESTYPHTEHGLAFLQFGRRYPVIQPSQPFFLRHKSPPPQLFADTFVSVYPKVEVHGQNATSPVQPFFLRYQSPPPSLFFDTFASVYSKVEKVTSTQQPPTAGQPFFLQYKSPSPTLFADTFAGVYPRIEAYSPQFIQPIVGVRAFAQRPSTRWTEDEPTFSRFNHQQYFSFGQTQVPAFFGYTFDQPDFNDNPWIEWVPQPLSPQARLFPFRQVPQIVIGQAWHLLFWESVNLRVEAETDFRVPDTQTLNAFRWTPIIQPIVFETVMATQVGFYQNETRNIGDVFIIKVNDFADNTIDYIPQQIGRPLFGWMVVVPTGTPLIANGPTPLTTANKPRTVF